MVEFQVSQRDKLLQIGYESTLGGVTKLRDVMHVRSLRGDRSSHHFLKTWPVDAWTKPIGAHVFGGSEVVLSRVLHGKEFSEGPPEAR